MGKFYSLIWFVLGMFAAWIILAFLRNRKNIPIAETSLSETNAFAESSLKAESILVKTAEDSSNAIIMISKAYYLGISGFHSEDRELLGKIEAEIEEFNQRVRKLKANTYMILQQLQQGSIETGHFYVQIVDYMREMAHSIKYVVLPLNEHLMNNHKPFAEDQNGELTQLSSQVTDFLNFALHVIKESRFEQIEELIQKRQSIHESMREQEKLEIHRIKRKETSSSNSVLYFGVLSETKNLLLQTVNLLKATRDFVSYTKS